MTVRSIAATRGRLFFVRSVKMNAKELAMYTYAANASFNQSMAQTLGGLAEDAAKAKPQV